MYDLALSSSLAMPSVHLSGIRNLTNTIEALHFAERQVTGILDMPGEEIAAHLKACSVIPTALKFNDRDHTALKWVAVNIELQENVVAFKRPLQKSFRLAAKYCISDLIEKCKRVENHELTKDITKQCARYFNGVVKLKDEETTGIDTHEKLSKDIAEWHYRFEAVRDMLDIVSMTLDPACINVADIALPTLETDETTAPIAELGWTPRSIKDTIKTLAMNVSTAELLPALDTMMVQLEEFGISDLEDTSRLANCLQKVYEQVIYLASRELELKSRGYLVCFYTETVSE